MATFYTLDEAARVLGMSPDELKAKAQHREVRAFMDNGTWQFRVADVDELARRRGLGSDPELSLSDLDLNLPPGSGSEEIDLSEFQLGVAGPDLGAPTMDIPSRGHDDDRDLLLDEMSLPPGPVTGSSSTIIGMQSSGKLPSDSDVRLIPDSPRSGSDSDVRLSPSLDKLPSDSDVTLIRDDDSADDLSHASGSPGDTAVRQSPMLGSSAEVPAAQAHDSDFELSGPSSVIDALTPESGSDFELTALDGSSDEFESTPIVTGPGDSDVTAAEPAASGINLGAPGDSGINLMGAGTGAFNLDQADSIELTPLDDDDAPKRPAPKPKAATPPPAAAAAAKKPEKDIFEDTDFEVDALGSDESGDDRTVQLEAASDFEIEDSESASEVFAIDEDDVDQNAATAMAPAVLDDEDDDGFDDAVSGEVSGSGGGWDVERDEDASPSRPVAASAMMASAGSGAEWGPIWVGVLGFAGVLTMLLAFVSLDLVRNMYEFHESRPGSGIIKSIAGLIGG